MLQLYIYLNSVGSAESRVQGESRVRDENVVSEISHSLDGKLKSMRAATGQDNIIGRDWGGFGRVSVTDSLTGWKFSN